MSNSPMEKPKLTLDTLALQVQNLQEEIEERDERIVKLEEWRRTCGMVASTWGGVCIAFTTIGGIIASFRTEIIMFIKGMNQ